MSRRVFSSAVLLLFAVWMCTTSGGASAEDKLANKIDPFAGTTRVSSRWKEVKGTEKRFSSLSVPSLVKVGDDVFVIAEAQCEEGKDCGAKSRTGIVSRHLKETDARTEILAADTSLLGVQVLKDGAADAVTATEMRRPTTVVTGDSVYMLLGNYGEKASATEPNGANDRGLLLVKGSVTEEGGNKKITWGDTHAVNPEARGQSEGLKKLIGGGGSGVATEDGMLVFPVQAKGADGRDVSLVMRFISSEKKWMLSHGIMGEGCGSPSVVEWGAEKNLILMASCASGQYNLHVSTVDGLSWYQNRVPITRVWGNPRDRTGYGVQSGFITATIEKQEVMLVTLPVHATTGGTGELHLWVTDNARVHDVGPVSQNDAAAGSSLLYDSEKGELLSVYEKKNDESYSLVVVRLTEQLGRVRGVVGTWKALDNALENCGSSSEIGLLKRNSMCTGPVPTKGLVGLLSGKSTKTEWTDEYLGVNARVTNAARVANGLTFKGVGAGAEWPVGNQGQSQPYHFANRKFSLVATLSIHEVPGAGSSPVPLMGVRVNDGKKTALFGLSYTHDRKWASIPSDHDAPEERVEDWKPNTTHQVALIMNTDGWYIFVDGRGLYAKKESDERFKTLLNAHGISDFFFGAGSEKVAEGSHVTVANVALYNRLLTVEDVEKLNASKVSIPEPDASQPDGEDGDKPRSGDSTVHVCVSPVLLLALVVGLWGMTALC